MTEPRPRRDAMEEPPVDLGSLLRAIAEREASLPKRLKQVAEIALRSPQEFAFNTTTRLAETAGVQPSTLDRFSKAFGFPGFSAMQAVFRAHARQRWPDYGERLRALQISDDGRNTRALIAAFADAAVQSAQRVTADAETARIEAAAEAMAVADAIYVVGVRRAFPAAFYLSYALRQMKVRCEVIDLVGGGGADQVAMLGPHDVLVAVSFAPYNALVRELASSAAAHGARLIAITDSPLSPLVPSAYSWIQVVEADHAGFRSLAGTFVVASVLAIRTAEMRGLVP